MLNLDLKYNCSRAIRPFLGPMSHTADLHPFYRPDDVTHSSTSVDAFLQHGCEPHLSIKVVVDLLNICCQHV